MGKFDLHFIWNEAVTDAPCAARTNIGYDPEAAFRIAVNAVIEGCAFVAERENSHGQFIAEKIRQLKTP